MTARTVSEIANWDGHLNQQRQNSQWRHSSSSHARDAYHTPQQNQSFEIPQPPGKISDQKRVDRSAFRSNLERDSFANPPVNARLLGSRLDTTPTSSHSKRHYHQPSLSNTAPNPAITSSPFIASSKSSHLTPNSSVLASHVHNSRLPSSREPIALLQPASTIDSEVIDLTVEDTKDELSVIDVLVPNATHFSKRHADPGPNCQSLSSGHSSPIDLEQSLFTPPPRSRRRTRMFIDYLAVPPFPKGLTKADYQPMSDHSVPPLPAPTVPSMVRDFSPAESPVTKERTPSVQKLKGKEREHDVVSSHKYKQRAPTNRADVSPNAIIDAFYEPTMIPLEDDDTYPPLTTLDLATNTRFQFAHAWRGHASRLREAELDCMFKFRLPEKVGVWARSVDTSSPRMPGTVGYVSIEQLRPWQLVLPESSPQEKIPKHVLDERAHLTESYSAAEADANYLSLPSDALPVPSLAVDPTLSNPTVSQGSSSTAIDMERDMDQYLNGLSDSPSKHVPPRQQLTPTHTLRSHLLQAAGQAEMNTLGLEFPSFEPDPRLADTGSHECFLGVPPSPTPVDMDLSMAPGPTPDSPFEPLNYFPASPSNLFSREATSTNAWSLEQGEGLLPDNNLLPNNHALPTVLGTIDPSLLGPGQPQTPPLAPTDTTLKRRSKLPELVIYIRRPIDSSTLPLVSGKRPVQIKYRDSGGTPATPSTQIGSNEAPSNLVENPIEVSKNDMDNSPRTKRRSVPSLKLLEYHTASESDSDYTPETSKSKLELKHKRRSVGDRVSVADRQATIAETPPTMSCCHQCRNTTQRPKMLCSNMVEGRVCGRRFCNRCILNRYPDVTFDEHSAGFLCPICTNTCNCSICSRNRGEEYISMRLGGLAASIFKTKVTLVRDVGEPLHRPKSPPRHVDERRSASETTTPTPEPGAVLMQSQFWAHVYGMEGERVGSAFMTREQMEHLRTRGPSLPPPPPNSQPTEKAQKPTRREKKRERTRGPRVFVGCPLESWKLRAVRDLEPSVDLETILGNKEKGSMTDHASSSSRRRRCYIGNPAPLYEPYGHMPGTTSTTPELDSDGSLTPLSDLEVDYWPQPDVGECCSWAPPPPPGAATWGPALLSGLGSPPGALGIGTDLNGQQGQGSGSGSGVEVEVDMDMDVAADGNEPVSASTTALSEEEVARAISAALATLSFGPPS